MIPNVTGEQEAMSARMEHFIEVRFAGDAVGYRLDDLRPIPPHGGEPQWRVSVDAD